jgi:hypothetical protein
MESEEAEHAVEGMSFGFLEFGAGAERALTPK